MIDALGVEPAGVGKKGGGLRWGVAKRPVRAGRTSRVEGMLLAVGVGEMKPPMNAGERR